MTDFKVLCDVDGVLADFTQGFLDNIEAVTGISFRPEQVVEWDFSKVLRLLSL